MESPSTQSSSDQSLAWQALAVKLEAFIVAWDQADRPPNWLDYLADIPAPQRRQAALELIKIDLEYRWSKLKQPRYIESYLKESPEVAEPFPVELLYEEFHLAQRSGRVTESHDLLKRFPEQALDLKKLIGTQQSHQHTTVAFGTSSLKQSTWSIGDRLEDFDLLTELGKGAFGTVYLAWQRSMQRQVALKITSNTGTEPQTLAQLDHEHIIRVYDQRELTGTKLRLMYMQYAAGGTLKEVIEHLGSIPATKRTGADYLRAVDAHLVSKQLEIPAHSPLRQHLASMTWPQLVCWIGIRLAKALGYAHQQGVLHRDIKPANVLLTHEGVPKLADFNISFSATQLETTADSHFGGSLAYMSPEQLRVFGHLDRTEAAELDQRSDLYSLGMLLVELLTGERPFDQQLKNEGHITTLKKLLEARLQGCCNDRWTEQVQQSAPCFDRVLASCLSPAVMDRPQHGEQLQRQIGLCCLPATQKLIDTQPAGWIQFVRRWPTLSIVVLCLLPNIFAGALNYSYNYAEIIQHLTGAETVFFWVQAAINGLFFPAGALWGACRVWQVTPFVHNQRLRDQLTDEQLAVVRSRALRLGHTVATIGIVLWTLGGITFPVAMHIGLGVAPVSMYGHFIGSLLVCGLIAAAYPFFFATLISLRCFYPCLIRHQRLDSPAATELEQLGKRSWAYFALAALVPMIAVLMLSMLTISSTWAPVISACGGILGFAGAWFAVRQIQADIAALAVLTHSELPGT